VENVEGMHVTSSGGPLPTFSLTTARGPSSLIDFTGVTIDDVTSTIRHLPDNSCAADVLLTPHLKRLSDLVAPFLVDIFNCSFSTATVPDVLKSVSSRQCSKSRV